MEPSLQGTSIELTSVEPETSPLWTDPDRCLAPSYAGLTEQNGIAGLTADKPGKWWSYITGHLKTLETTRSYFDHMEDVKVPAFWSNGLTSVSHKEVSQNGWARCTGMPPDLLNHFDFSLLEPQEKIPDGNGSWFSCNTSIVHCR